jgi:tellurite resistance protein
MERPKATMSTDDQKARARALFKKEEKRYQERVAVSQYQAEQDAIREKTERLRAQRLARDAAAVDKADGGRPSE